VGGIAATRRKYAFAGMQGDCLSEITFRPSLLDNGNWPVKDPKASDGGFQGAVVYYSLRRQKLVSAASPFPTSSALIAPRASVTLGSKA